MAYCNHGIHETLPSLEIPKSLNAQKGSEGTLPHQLICVSTHALSFRSRSSLTLNF